MDHEIRPGDCIKGMAKVEERSVDLVFADPPFNIGFDYDVYDDKRTVQDYLTWSKQWIAGVERVLKASGSFWLAIGDEYVSELDIVCKNEGFRKRSHVIWHYTFGVNCANNFTRSHTHLLYYTKQKSNFTFNADQVRLPSARQLVYNDQRQNPDGRLPDNTWIMRPQDIPFVYEETGDVWHCPRICGTFKGRQKLVKTQMPEQILGRIIRLCSNVGDLVMDPFSGSGTTIAVAKKLGRLGLGFELSKEYGKAANARVAMVKPASLLDPPHIDPAPKPPKKKSKRGN
jgi:site-specific DNA-methyltransferase (adenine-specific)